MSSVSGYAELLLNKRGMSPEERDDYLNVILNNSRRAGNLLTALFELSALDSPDFTLSPVRLDTCEYLRGVCAELLPVFDRAGFACEFNIPETPVFAVIDPIQMTRVLTNLADNAVRYTAAGTEVTVRLSSEGGACVIRFADNGAGITDDVAAEIFKPFVRADTARNSKTGGTGLGLSIAQKIVALHGGAISLETGDGRGCVFLISLPTI